MPESSGTVTFLFTDIEGSTGLWQRDEAAMRAALSRHDELLRRAVADDGGTVFSSMGDGIAAVFVSASGAVRAALAAQRLVDAEAWPTVTPVRVRMGLHTGEAELRDGDYFGTAVNRAARLMAVGHGGQVLCSQATAGLVEAGVELVDLGEHRLRDLDRPMHVFQVGDGGFAPLRSLDVLPGNLPLLASSFVGRRLELAAVAKELAGGRLVTLTGVGGVGKTRLALQVAAELLPGYADGAWLCELAAAANADDLAQVVAIALGVAQRSGMSLADSIVDFLRPRRTLIILDNCEHLLDATAELAEVILAGAAAVRVLATSREGLGIPGEHCWPLPSLALPTDIAGAGESDAVRLFADRARAVDPSFVLDNARTPAVAEVCRRLDGIPLAIELAAARVVAMSPAEIAGHLDERFRLLTGGRRGRVERHQTLQAAVEWSYALLDDTERAAFDRLGVFPASFDEAGAVAVCAGDEIERWDVIDALVSLVAKSMVGVDRSGAATRYQLLETLRHFARDRAAATGNLEGLRRRHAAHFAELAERIGAGLASSDELVWRPRLAAELDNLRAATGWALDAASLDDVALGVRILDALLLEASVHNSWGILAWAATTVSRVDQLDAARRSVILAAAAAAAFYYLGQVDRAQALGGRVIAESPTLTPALVTAVNAVSYSKLVSGDPTGATAILAESGRRLQAGGASDVLRCAQHITACSVAYYVGDVAAAQSEAQRGLTTARRLGMPTMLALALSAHALTMSDRDPEEALAAAEESIRLIENGAGDTIYSWALQIAASLHLAKGHIPRAAAAIRAGVGYEGRNGTSRATLATLVALAAQVLAGHPPDFHAAARLRGAVNGPVFGHIEMYLRGAQRDRYDQALAAVSAAMGADAYREAQQGGATMSYDQIISFALTHLAPLVQAAPPTDT